MTDRLCYNRRDFFTFILILSGAVSTVMIFSVCRYFGLRILFAPVLIMGMFLLLNYRVIGKNSYEPLKYLLLGSIIFLAFHFLYTISKSYLAIPQWDYIAFYLYSLAGQSGGNFYDPELFREIFGSHKLGPLTTPVFVEEVVDVGFPYPPFAMLLFFPLGWFDLQTGYFIWQSILIIFLIAGIYLLLNIFSPGKENGNEKIIFTMVIIHLIFLFPGITSSFRFAQTSPVIFLFLLLLLKRLNHWDAGIYLAIMIMIKPLAVLFGVWFLMNRRWNVIAAAFVSGVVILVMTAMIFGFNVFTEYFASPPTDRIPEFVYSEPINKSLSAVLLRLYPTHLTFMDQSGITMLIISISILLLGFTAMVSRRIAEKSARLSFLVFIPFGLLVYPASLAHYSLLLIPVILGIFREKYRDFDKPLFLILLIAIYLAAFYNMFYLNVLLLSYFSYLALRFKTQNHSVANQPAIPGIQI